MQLHGEGVTHVSGTKCHLCLGPLIRDYRFMHDFSMLGRSGQANPKLPRQDFDTLARVPVVMPQGHTLVEKFARQNILCVLTDAASLLREPSLKTSGKRADEPLDVAHPGACISDVCISDAGATLSNGKALPIGWNGKFGSQRPRLRQ